MSGSASLSPELQAAQELLYQKRAAARAERLRLGLPVDLAKTQAEPQPRPSTSDIIRQLPPHLGWENQSYTQWVRASQPQPSVESPPAEPIFTPEPPVSSSVTPQTHRPFLRIFGHVCDAIYRQNLASPGRVWLLLRYLDQAQGTGRVALSTVKEALTHKENPLACLSWKRLRQILQEGENIFWHRSAEGEMVYYHSEVRVALTLGLKRIGGWAVQIEVSELVQPIQNIKALFYDAFHSARGDGLNMPITRHMMDGRGQGDRRTQRKYEAQRGIQNQANYAHVGRYSPAKWQQAKLTPADMRVGGPAFIFVDYEGVLGQQPGRLNRPENQQHWHNIYIMRRIGNAYSGTLPTAKRGRKWTNRKLKHLYDSMPITGSFAVEEEAQNKWVKLYYTSVDVAEKKRTDELPAPWYHPCGAVDNRPVRYWQEHQHQEEAPFF